MPPEHILVLEDHADLREQIRHILTGAGYQVQTAGTCAEALQATSSTHFDVLIADVFLPDGSGLEVFSALRVTHPDLAGIVITGFSTWETAMEAVRCGFVGFIVKPFVAEQLITAVVAALEQEKLRLENARLHALVPLYELSRAFMGTFDHVELVNKIIATAREATRAESVSLMLCDPDGRELRIAAAVGLPTEVIDTGRRLIGTGIAGHVALTGKPIIIAAGYPLDPEIRDELLRRTDIESALSLPLISRGLVIGVLNLARGHGGAPFTSGDLEFATVLAGQAAISIDNARLFKQLSLLSDMSQRLALSLDLDDAIAVITGAPGQLIDAKGAALWLVEANLEPKMVSEQGLGSRAIPPLNTDGLQEQFTPEGTEGWLTVPLRHGEKTLGALTVLTASSTPPSEDRIGLLRTLGHAASAIIESHRLRTREVTAFREVDRAVRSDLSVRQQLERLLDQMVSACGAENGTIFRWDQEDDLVQAWVTVGRPIADGLARTVITEGRVGFLADAANLQDVAIGAPMRVGSRIEGAAILTRPRERGPFAIRQLELLSTLTSSAALIVRNTQLYARSEEAAIAEERTRIAREIHDGLAQDLSFLVLKTSAAQKLLSRAEPTDLARELREITDQLRQDAREVRRVIFALRPLDIESLGFKPALEKFVKEFAQANDIDTRLEAQGDFAHLPPKLETALFRLVQEALNNIRKHARARHAWVDIDVLEGHTVVLCIRDNGRGFDVASAMKAAQARGSVGLVQMRERAERAGGTFTITSQVDEGTCIQVELPVREM